MVPEVLLAQAYNIESLLLEPERIIPSDELSQEDRIYLIEAAIQLALERKSYVTAIDYLEKLYAYHDEKTIKSGSKEILEKSNKYFQFVKSNLHFIPMLRRILKFQSFQRVIKDTSFCLFSLLDSESSESRKPSSNKLQMILDVVDKDGKINLKAFANDLALNSDSTEDLTKVIIAGNKNGVFKGKIDELLQEVRFEKIARNFSQNYNEQVRDERVQKICSILA